MPDSAGAKPAPPGAAGAMDAATQTGSGTASAGDATAGATAAFPPTPLKGPAAVPLVNVTAVPKWVGGGVLLWMEVSALGENVKTSTRAGDEPPAMSTKISRPIQPQFSRRTSKMLRGSG